MMKKLVILFACLGLAFQLSSCTSKDSQPEAEVAADVDSADLEKLEGDGSLEVASDDSLSSDQLPEDALGETNSAAEATTEKVSGDTAAAPAAPAEDIAASAETMPADPFAETTSSEAAPPAPPLEPVAETSVPATTEDTAMTEPTTDSSTTIVEPEPPKKVVIPLQKVATTPWKVGKTLYNAVYFVRPGDSLASISQMLYGSDKTGELKKGNPTYASREVRPGDKVYYNSPQRPEDAARVLTYHEDTGMAPEVYIAKSGDNIRKVAKDLLGYDNAWKEVWASNSVDSKGALEEGTELRYWKGQAVAAAPAAVPQEAVPAAQEPQAPVVQQEMAQQEIPPPPMPEIPQEQAAEMAPPPPMPEIPQEQAPPPPPMQAMNPPADQMPTEGEEATPTEMDQDTTMALGVVGLAAAGLAIIVMRRKRRQRDLEMQAMDNTHVGT